MKQKALDNNIEIMDIIENLEKQRDALLIIVSDLQTQIKSYQNHLEVIEKLKQNVDSDWLNKSEEPSPHYLIESELNFKNND